MNDRIIYLVPGFFGFTQLGALNYFNGVKDTLADAFEDMGLSARIVECSTQPTGSITEQANRLADEVIQSGGLDADELHFIGHSAGGLNARLLVSPGVDIRGGSDEKQIGERTRSVITVSTPHYGTPLANFFTSLNGRYMLQFLTVLAGSSPGRRSIFLASRFLSLLAKADSPLLKKKNILDELSDRFFDKVSLDPNDPIWRFLKEVASDQGAIIQLTPEGVRLLNAAAVNREGVAYRCVLTAAPPPRVLDTKQLFAVDRWAFHLIFNFLYRVAAREHSHYPYPPLPRTDATDRMLSKLPFSIDTAANDGVVPTMSQLWGEPIAAAVSDHLDVVGQYRDKDEPFRDWLPSGSTFGKKEFQEIWRDIAAAVKEASAG